MAYDVFISFKNTAADGTLTRDRAIAEQLHSMLRSEGLEVFFSEKDLSTTAFMDELYRALDEAQLLIVVGTSLEYVESRWVKNEWQNFLGAINSGKKSRGQIMTVLEGISAAHLPIEISNFQSFATDSLDEAVDFAFHTLGKVKNSQVAARLALERERAQREDEEAALRRVRLEMEAEYAQQNERRYLTEQAAQAADLKQRMAANQAELERIKEKKQEADRRREQQAQAVRRQRTVRAITTVVCIAILAVLAALVGIQSNKPLHFSEVSGGYEISGCSGDYSEPALPDTYKGQPVIGIAPEAFMGCESLTSVVIPDSVEYIGDGAFKNCTNLTSVTLPDGITAISSNIFWGCEALVSCDIPESVTTIGDSAFYRCESLLTLTIPDGVTHIGDGAFHGCLGLASLSVPDSVTYLGDEAFSGCSRLTSITLPDGITHIGYAAFSGCSDLLSVDIPGSVTSIDSDAFSYCKRLTEIAIPASVTRIDKTAFGGCEELADILVAEGNPAYCDVDGVLFSADLSTLVTFPCGKAVVSYSIPDGVEVIGDFAFDSCQYVRNITIPDSVVTINSNSFFWYSLADNQFYTGDRELYHIVITAPYDARHYDYSPNNCIEWVVD